ncbi:MAG: glycoside hydrolase family 127 protein [Desulfomicrobium escambiense]|nr:glycoside hydrolase family 127 protein [Desulfomicrobium escambiense]
MDRGLHLLRRLGHGKPRAARRRPLLRVGRHALGQPLRAVHRGLEGGRRPPHRDDLLPGREKAALTVGTAKPRRFTVALRRPFWAGEGFSVEVNGKAVKDPGPAGTYVRITRKWQVGRQGGPGPSQGAAAGASSRRSGPGRDPVGTARPGGRPGPGPAEAAPRRGRRDGRNGVPVADDPVLVTAETSPDKWITPAEGRPGVFRTSGAGRDRDVDLVPFHRLHRRVYAAYWDILTPGEWTERAAALKAAEEARRELEAATVAFAQPGQMQAERDLNMQGGKTSPVQMRSRYGRRAADWFSFDLPVDPASPLMLVVTYNRDERADRAFAVLVDGRKVGEERIPRRAPQEKEGFFDVSYGLPGRGRRRQEQGHGPVRGHRRLRDRHGVRHPHHPER